MTWLLSLATAAIMAVVGGVALGVLADRWTVWFRVSGADGAAGYFVLLYILVGAAGGFLAGLLCAAFAAQGSDARFLTGLRVAMTWVLGTVAALAVVTYLVADHPPRWQGHRLVLDVELRIDPATTPPVQPETTFTVTLENSLGKITSWRAVPWQDLRVEPEFRILPFAIPLNSSSARRTLLIQWHAGTQLTLELPLARRPAQADFDWSPWLESRFLNTPSPPADGSTPPPAPPRIRIRLRVPPPPPPKPSAAEVARQQEEETRARLAALPAEAPLEARLPFTRHNVSAGLRAAALQGIRSHERFDTGFSTLVVDDRPELAAEALRLVSQLPRPKPPLIEPVTAAGRDLQRRLELGLVISQAQDPGYDWAAALSIRFAAWFDAVLDLRQHAGGDFTPELRSILLLARQRPDSEALRRDVVRVASDYLHAWSGDPPLPTDPPPL